MPFAQVENNFQLPDRATMKGQHEMKPIYRQCKKILKTVGSNKIYINITHRQKKLFPRAMIREGGQDLSNNVENTFEIELDTFFLVTQTLKFVF